MKNTTDAVIAAQENNEAKAKPGRPVVQGSARQIRLAAMQARKEANGGQIKLGRPAMPDSKRQQQLVEIAERKANGYVAQRGRPSFASLGLQTKKEAEKQSKTTNIVLKAEATPVVEAIETVEVNG
jgi:hypothetical protein